MITIRHATERDSKNLIQLTGLTPMRGQISLRIDRKPDFFLLLKERGDSIILVGENQHNEIIGCFAASCRNFFIRHEEKTIYYLGDLKVHPDYTGSTLAYRLVKKMHEELKTRHAEFLFCVTAHGNNPVIPFFVGKAGFPPFQNIGQFNIYQILPKRRKDRSSSKKIVFTDPGLIEFFSEKFYRYDFCPKVFGTENMQHLVSKKDNKILAAISLYDSTYCKQNVVIGYPYWIGITLNLLRILKNIFPLPPIPKKHQPLKILNIKYYAMADGCENEFKTLLEEARHYAFENNFHFLSIGTDKNDCQYIDILKKIKSFVFKSNAWICNMKNDYTSNFKASPNLLFEDFSIV